jgi:hypothetical protein
MSALADLRGTVYIIHSNVLDLDYYFSVPQASYWHVSMNRVFAIYRYIVAWTLHEPVRFPVLPPKVEPGLLEGRLCIS